MSPFEWAAVFGAAAWVPHVVSWAVRLFAQPKVRVIAGRNPEVGYTSLGPIFNLTCAISASRKDAVIERLVATVTHERGQSIVFQWVTLNETLSQVRGPDGVTEVGKNQPAVALKVSTLVLTEKQIGMQAPSFEEERNVILNALVEQQSHLKKTEPEGWKDLVTKSKELADLVELYRRSQPWQIGQYSVRLTLHLAGVRKPTEQAFHFRLTANDVERLEQNIPEITRNVADAVVPPEDGEPSYSWNWIYPPFAMPALPAKT